jgi:hypothetical protein
MTRLLLLLILLGLLFTIYWYYDKIMGEDTTKNEPKIAIKSNETVMKESKHKKINLSFIYP